MKAELLWNDRKGPNVARHGKRLVLLHRDD
jgi:hypothetical protein